VNIGQQREGVNSSERIVPVILKISSYSLASEMVEKEAFHDERTW
jgi:hypothetical protein